MNKFAVFILSHGRPEKVITYNKLSYFGYTGKKYIVIDDEDKTKEEYKKIYGDAIIVFSKGEISSSFDIGDNFEGHKGVVYVRNAIFNIAEEWGYCNFLVLDDDYNTFSYRVIHDYQYAYKNIKNLDAVFKHFITYLNNSEISCITMAQGGDYIGGVSNNIFESLGQRRKCMNTFFCRTDRKFIFNGRINEDVNMYVTLGGIGYIFIMCPLVSIKQAQTQIAESGMTDLYRDNGTYVKSFYSIMMCPSAIKIDMVGNKDLRLHHRIEWNNAVPVIIDEKYKKNE